MCTKMRPARRNVAAALICLVSGLHGQCESIEQPQPTNDDFFLSNRESGKPII